MSLVKYQNILNKNKDELRQKHIATKTEIKENEQRALSKKRPPYFYVCWVIFQFIDSYLKDDSPNHYIAIHFEMVQTGVFFKPQRRKANEGVRISHLDPETRMNSGDEFRQGTNIMMRAMRGVGV